MENQCFTDILESKGDIEMTKDTVFLPFISPHKSPHGEIPISYSFKDIIKKSSEVYQNARCSTTSQLNSQES